MLRIVPLTVPRVGRSYEHFPDGFELHLLQVDGGAGAAREDGGGGGVSGRALLLLHHLGVRPGAQGTSLSAFQCGAAS